MAVSNSIKPHESKISALLTSGHSPDFSKTTKVLYLGAGHGSSLKFLQDIVDVIYAVEFAPEPMRKLVGFAGKTDNIIPIFADARHPEIFASILEEVDIILEDISQSDQVQILCSNSIFLKKGGISVLFLKTRAINSRKNETDILYESVKKFSGTSLTVIEHFWLEPSYPDHGVIILQKE